MVTDLPVEGSLGSLRSALSDPGHAVLVAPPGSGKTTIVPLRLLDEPWLAGRRITVLEPRRLATRAAARRMAFLLGEEVGETAGYVTRTDRRVGPNTRIEVVTEGVLTRRLQRDPELPGVGLVVFDEFHERNLQTDLGLALALDTRRTLRPDLRLLVMSATIDADRVAALLGGSAPAPIVRSEAFTHPVEIRWEPKPRQTRLEPHVAAVVRRALTVDEGDVLVFLPGIGEINRVMRDLDGVGAEVHRLHGSLSIEEQDAALAPGAHRKVVLATDIAETSLTVEGVTIVVDGGTARAPRFDARTGMTRLKTIPISKASAEQRSGRAGRTRPGVAYRVWSKVEHGPRKAHIEPEITQVDLAGFALELAAWGAREPAELDFLDAPPRRSYAEARRLLELLGAVDQAGGVTDAGRAMADLPLHPRLAHMIVSASADDRYLACVLAAAVDDRDILRGHPEETPVDVAVRVELATGVRGSHQSLDRRALDRLRRTASDLARRAGVPDTGRIDADHCGRVLALAFPDRLAVQRGSPGRFQLRTGTSGWVPSSDSLAAERFVVVADLDGKRKDARIRLAAPLEAEEVASAFAHEVEERSEFAWEGDRLVERRTIRLGGMILSEMQRRADPGPEATRAVVERLRERHLEDLPWSDATVDLRQRVRFLRNRMGEPWPDWSIPMLERSLEEWLVPYLGSPTGLDRLERLDLASLLRRHLGYPLAGEVDRLAPKDLDLPGGRPVRVDYSGETPRVSVRVQRMFGVTSHPLVGGEPVLFELLSPADRPLQLTQDLPGFWAGSWADVRKEMAGRYPKHDWPEDPAGWASNR